MQNTFINLTASKGSASLISIHPRKWSECEIISTVRVMNAMPKYDETVLHTTTRAISEIAIIGIMHFIHFLRCVMEKVKRMVN